VEELPSVVALELANFVQSKMNPNGCTCSGLSIGLRESSGKPLLPSA
jgi:hypothetical protein